MFSSAAIFVCRSRVFASFNATVRFSSAAEWPMVEMVRLMRSGDCTMRVRVRFMFSEEVAISAATFSCKCVPAHQSDECQDNKAANAYLLSDERCLFLLEALDLLQETHLLVFVRNDLLHQRRVLLSQSCAFRLVLCAFDPVLDALIARQ